MGLFWMVLAVLAGAGGLLYRRRLREGAPSLSDEEIRRIERGEYVELEEPLDLDEARDAEDEFWGEEWDEPEMW
ncbi:MAG TPA: hypothetical protein VMK65_00955 [Longimicrobiales bacterium]|nr:hypothetical protein [Longimicrobiales bacterium]